MLFSVIVPIYNIEKYLRRCIQSVLDQTYLDFELILVDDGSPDNCPRICDEYEMSDERIRVIHKENGGLVSARVAGVGIARGDYIFHLDGDDAISPDALESAARIISDTNADIVSFSYRRSVNGQLSEQIDELVREGFYSREEIEEHLYPHLLSDENMQHLFYFLWGKAIKRDIATRNQLNVNPAISLGEDLSCIIPCYLDAQSVYVSHRATYLYTIRDDSISTDFKVGQITQIEDVIFGLRKLEGRVPSDFDEQISRYSAFMCFAILAAAAEGGHFRSLESIRGLILSSLHRIEIKKAHFANITVKSRIALALMKMNCIRVAFYFLYLCKVIKMHKKG